MKMAAALSDHELAARVRTMRQPQVDVERGMYLRGRPLQEAMQRMGFTKLRESQVAPIESVLAGRDVLVVLPTSGGKTAIFVLPTLAADYRTLVFSPLIALMRDQVLNLRASGLSADYVNSSRTPQEIDAVLHDWTQGKVQFLYVAPERLARPDFKAAMAQRAPDMVAVDECFTPETEILTEDGFVAFADLAEGVKVAQVDPDTQETTFVLPEKIIRKPYEGDLVHLWSKKYADLKMTPNHQLLAYYGDGRWKKEAVSNIHFNHLKRFLAAAPVADRPAVSLTSLDRLKIAYQADGSEHNLKASGLTTASFSFKKQRKISRFLALVESCGLVYHEVKDSRPGRRRFIVQDVPGLSKRLSDMFDLKSMSAAYAAEFVDEASNWDGHVIKHTGQLYYSSVVKENADFLQVVAVLAGYKTNLIEQQDDRSETFSTVYRLFIHTDRSHFGAQALQVERVPYTGEVHCVRVPHGNIIVRGNGKTMVIGNCHCVSMWSDIFRHSYCFIGDFIEEYRPKTVVAVTATCNESIEKDVYRVLGLPSMSTIWRYYPRNNLTLKSKELISLDDVVREIQEIEGRIIVYFSTVARLEKTVPKLSEALNETVGMYHGQLNRNLKDNLQDMFRDGRVKIMAATSAFGMGVDIPAIRSVIHHDPPGNPEALSQEVGRAGRDELPSTCISFHHSDGWRTQRGFIERGYPEEDTVRAVYRILRREGSGGKVIRMTAKDMARAAKVSEFGSDSVLQLLMGHRVLRALDQKDRTCSVGFLGNLEDDRFHLYKKTIEDNGVLEHGLYRINIDFLRARLGSPSEETVRRWLTEWSKRGVIHFEPPFGGQLRVLENDLSVIDFSRLKETKKLLWRKLGLVESYMTEVPDAHKQDFLKSYFEGKL